MFVYLSLLWWGTTLCSKFTFSNARNKWLLVSWWINVGAHLFCYKGFTEFSFLLLLDWSGSWMWFVLYLMPRCGQSLNSSIRPSTSMFGPTIFMKISHRDSVFSLPISIIPLNLIGSSIATYIVSVWIMSTFGHFEFQPCFFFLDQHLVHMNSASRHMNNIF